MEVEKEFLDMENPYNTLKRLFTEVPKVQKVEDYEQFVTVFLGKHA